MNKIFYYLLIISGSIILITNGCEKNDIKKDAQRIRNIYDAYYLDEPLMSFYYNSKGQLVKFIERSGDNPITKVIQYDEFNKPIRITSSGKGYYIITVIEWYLNSFIISNDYGGSIGGEKTVYELNSSKKLTKVIKLRSNNNNSKVDTIKMLEFNWFGSDSMKTSFTSIDCKTCKLITIEQGRRTEGHGTLSCGKELEEKENSSPVIIGNKTTFWECNSIFVDNYKSYKYGYAKNPLKNLNIAVVIGVIGNLFYLGEGEYQNQFNTEKIYSGESKILNIDHNFFENDYPTDVLITRTSGSPNQIRLLYEYENH